MNRKLYYTNASKSHNLMQAKGTFNIFVVDRISKANNEVTVLEVGFVQNGEFYPEHSPSIERCVLDGNARMGYGQEFNELYVPVRDVVGNVPEKFRQTSKINLARIH